MSAELFKRVRQINGLSQESMATRLGISRSVVAKIETNIYPIRDHVKSKLYAEFGEEHIEAVRKLIK